MFLFLLRELVVCGFVLVLQSLQEEWEITNLVWDIPRDRVRLHQMSSFISSPNSCCYALVMQMEILSRMYPCKECADHFKEVIRCILAPFLIPPNSSSFLSIKTENSVVGARVNRMIKYLKGFQNILFKTPIDKVDIYLILMWYAEQTL